ncbi:beta-1,6-galactosyltransferase GALT31A-like isoform X4 [Ananas comosus]|uniref:Hexosyltransferase n=1 Tax=Ananas comosus TaxID=4615 RepID=A0A6P5G9R7_ANACO|nr:beta-1,6-galactosyltransferase GALT31A-like isoform X4 [Ananas comosus]
MGPAAAAAAAARPQKASAAGGVPARWVCALCASCFVFGVFVINRIWSVPEPVKLNEKALFVERTQTRLSEVYIPCQRKQNSIHIGEILNHVSQTHDVIMTLDKTISNLEMRLAAARAARATKQEKSLISADSDIELSKVRPKVFFVMGIITAFSSRKRRDSIRETWMPHGENLRRLEKEKGIVVRFVIGHSGTRGSLLDHTVDAEDEQYSDFLRLDHVEGYHELSSKTLIYFSTAVAIWDADFYIKVDDDVHVNIEELNIMSQNIGSLVRRETNTLDMQQDSCMLYPRNWLRIYQLIDIFCINMLMKTSPWVHGSSVSMWST